MPRESFKSLVGGAVLAATVWVGLNAAKPFHVDDPLFLYWSRTIAPLPGEAPIHMVNWERFDEPLAVQVHPKGPGLSLMLTGARRLWQDREIPHHWLQWPFAVMFIVGSGLLAVRFSLPAWPTAVLCATSPLFLMPAASLMADLGSLGPGVLGFALWLGAGSTTARIGAGALLVIAAQMKQTVFPLLPLLFVDPQGGLVRDRGRLLIAAGTCLLACYHPDLPPPRSSGGTVVEHLLHIFAWSWGRGGLLAPKAGYAMACFAAVALFPAAYALGVLAPRDRAPAFARFKAAGAAALAIMLLSLAGFWKHHPFDRGSFHAVPAGLSALWFYAAIALWLAWMWLARAGLLRGRNRWLMAWLGLVFAGALIGTPFPAARFLVFSLPALAILLVDDFAVRMDPPTFRRSIGLIAAGNLWLSAGLAVHDARLASFARTAASRAAALAQARSLPLMTTGQWGLRYYVERHGGEALGRIDDPLVDGAVMLAPHRIDHRLLPGPLRRRIRAEEAWRAPIHPVIDGLFPARPLPARRSAASFHGGHVWLPYAFERGPLETIDVLEIPPDR